MWSFRKFMESDISEVSEYLRTVSPPTTWERKLMYRAPVNKGGVSEIFEIVTDIKAPDLNYTVINTKVIKKSRRYGIFIPSFSSNFQTINIQRWQAIGHSRLVFIYLNNDGSIRNICTREVDGTVKTHSRLKKLKDLFGEFDAFKEIS